MSMALMVAMSSRKRDEDGRYMESEELRRMGNDHMTRMGGHGREMDDRPEMRRRRDDRGRFMEGEGDMRMGNDHSTHMGGYDRPENRMDTPEMRRRRDSRGRYMEGEDGQRMAYDGNRAAMRPWPEPHIPPYGDARMRDSNVVNIRDYQDRRRIIGFESAEDDDGGADMRQYGRRYDPDRQSARMHYGKQEQGHHQMGYAEGDEERLTAEEAEEWVRGMMSEDGKKGGRWELQDVKKYAGNYGVKPEEVVEFFAVLNALSTDYGKVAKKFGVDRMEFWAEMAKAFMHDKDAQPGKVKLYYECIAKKSDE
ncbi:MAG: hypothetical protein IKK57_10905 [Clostridia bacterium]|nr:hypothetical protein [Clostridia bacterium]